MLATHSMHHRLLRFPHFDQQTSSPPSSRNSLNGPFLPGPIPGRPRPPVFVAAVIRPPTRGKLECNPSRSHQARNIENWLPEIRAELELAPNLRNVNKTKNLFIPICIFSFCNFHSSISPVSLSFKPTLDTHQAFRVISPPLHVYLFKHSSDCPAQTGESGCPSGATSSASAAFCAVTRAQI